MLAVIPKSKPGIRLEDLKRAMVNRLGEQIRPGPHHWWTMAVKLHLEATGVIKREGEAPQRLTRTK